MCQFRSANWEGLARKWTKYNSKSYIYNFLLVMDEVYRAMKSITGHYAKKEPGNYRSVIFHQRLVTVNKVVPAFALPRHEGVRAYRMKMCSLQTSTLNGRRVVVCTLWSLYPLYRRISGLRNRSGICGVEESSWLSSKTSFVTSHFID
jgi:hypothetical protein